MKLKKSTVNALISYGIVIVAFIICQYLISAKAMPRTLKGQMIPICVYIVMAVSLNLVVGISGELSLGHAGFMSIGAFSGVIASTWMLEALGLENTLVRLIISILAGGAFAGVFGVLIFPTIVYLAQAVAGKIQITKLISGTNSKANICWNSITI